MIYLYIKYFFALIGSVIAAIFLFDKKRTVLKVNKLSGKQKEFAKKYGKKVNIIVRILCSILLITVVPLRVIPLTIDLPYVFTGKFQKVKVVTLTNSGGNDNLVRQRDVKIKELYDNKEYIVHLFHTAIKENEEIYIRILPFSKYGVVLEE